MTQVAPANESELYFQSLQQGSVLHRSEDNARAFTLLGEDCHAAAVVSQTCDVVLPKRPTVLLAPVVELHDEELRRARRRDNPRFVQLAQYGESRFADVCYIHATEKAALVGSEVADGIDFTDDAEVRTLALAIGRWFSRFAFPNEVVPWFRPLQEVIRSKYNRDLTDPSVERSVSGIAGTFWTDDEFPLSRYRKSELLDVDYLSAGYPL